MPGEDFGFSAVDAAPERITELVLADARRGGTTIAVWRDGRVVHLHPDEFVQSLRRVSEPTTPTKP